MDGNLQAVRGLGPGGSLAMTAQMVGNTFPGDL